jgi:hypothetical protein
VRKIGRPIAKFLGRARHPRCRCIFFLRDGIGLHIVEHGVFRRGADGQQVSGHRHIQPVVSCIWWVGNCRRQRRPRLHVERVGRRILDRDWFRQQRSGTVDDRVLSDAERYARRPPRRHLRRISSRRHFTGWRAVHVQSRQRVACRCARRRVRRGPRGYADRLQLDGVEPRGVGDGCCRIERQRRRSSHIEHRCEHERQPLGNCHDRGWHRGDRSKRSDSASCACRSPAELDARSCSAETTVRSRPACACAAKAASAARRRRWTRGPTRGFLRTHQQPVGWLSGRDVPDRSLARRDRRRH